MDLKRLRMDRNSLITIKLRIMRRLDVELF